MSFFGVTIETVNSVNPMENANTLEWATVEGMTFVFVVQKGKWKPGDKCLYFPIDSVVPLIIQEKLGVAGKLAGANRDRIKTIKLRGQISQGIITPVTLIDDLVTSLGRTPTPEEITNFLGVTKYDPILNPCMNGSARALPSWLSKYDIEGAERNKVVIDYLMDEDVVITEKLEGSNYSVSYDPKEDRHYVNSRQLTIIQNPGEEHDWWRVARELDFLGLTRYVAQKNAFTAPVTVYGEYIGPGVQGNIYKLAKPTVKIFDIKIGDHWLSYKKFYEIVMEYYRSTVPVIKEEGTVTADFDPVGRELAKIMAPVIFTGKLQDALKDRNIVEYSHGPSMLAHTYREGVVIRPYHEDQYLDRFGRVIIKQRCPIYLSKTDS